MMSRASLEAALALQKSLATDKVAQEAADDLAIRRAGLALANFLSSEEGKLVGKILAAKGTRIEIAREETLAKGAVLGKKKQPKTMWGGSWILDGRGLGHEFPGFLGISWLELRPEEAVKRAFRNRTSPIRPEDFGRWLQMEIERIMRS
ncbi:MAG: hypothetical protein A3C16_02500 [Candidatus Sungbacteria bacterium RIFCSPHIGHO2_02_FULL_51_29]|uniref:Uncharacterized protein n=1 Tax=Candidatus Sungbacteria bacterium RIFCSPHIGHO2_02_FULL_51_29 TaxID=1802273 RepID=A0A1G2KRD1_9BACT|nr:MAG: hypothetical protein A3C16_02500 [Candidatus Sungbacteria bacterium RIFCSPHIGHO2_02_FULL_51_29]